MSRSLGRLSAVGLAYVVDRFWRRRSLPRAVRRAAAPSPSTMEHVGAATAPSEEVAPELFRNT
jgi:hypothetical protein